MMHSVVATNNSSSDESTADLFSPVHGRQHSLHSDLFDDTPETPGANSADALPRLADNSWIGARVSPIPSVEDAEDDNDDLELDKVTAPYRKAMRDFSAHERSALLERRIHPMWNDDFLDDATRISGKKRKAPSRPIWGKAVVGTSALHMFCIILHDAYLGYVQIRRGKYSKYPIMWSIPWLGPSARILLRFGAYCPGKILWQRQWYRAWTSLTLTSSVSEWLVLALAWWQLDNTWNPLASNVNINWQFWWPIAFVLSIGTGQLWTAAFGSYYSLSGCAGWGTCGVLCATGASRPDHRLPLFLTAIALVLLNLMQSTSNVFGAIGASFFGWSFYGSGIVPSANSSAVLKENISSARGWSWLNVMAIVTVVKLQLLPILFIVIWKQRGERPDFDPSYPNSSYNRDS